jgi:hypothetical protein
MLEDPTLVGVDHELGLSTSWASSPNNLNFWFGCSNYNITAVTGKYNF